MHRFAYELYIGRIPDGIQVRHSCDNRRCVNPDHLSLGTNQDNVNDKMKRKRHKLGEATSKSKLKNNDVIQIRGLSGIGFTQREIAKKYNVAHCTIGCVLRNETWRHV